MSGAKWIWGGEAAAVQPDGRANPHQTLAIPDNRAGLVALLKICREAHREVFGKDDDLFVGLQLTHSGRFSRPHDKHLEPRIAYHHPLLDPKFGIDPHNDKVVWTDDDLERLIETYVDAAGLARDVGFQFVDIKSCHGYLLHEFLSARSRRGRFGGDLEGRTRMLMSIIGTIRDRYPDLIVVVRLSVFDILPYKTSRQIGEVTSSNEDHVGGDFPQVTCIKGACFLVWHEIEKGAQAALIDPDKGTMLWRKRFAPRGGHPAVTTTPDGLAEIAYYESGKVRIASVSRDGVSTTSTFARVTGDQPRPWIAPGRARGEWYVTWLDVEAGHTEAFVSRLQCRN